MFERIRKGLHSVSLVLVLPLNPDSHATRYYAGESCFFFFLYKLILCAGDCPCASFVPPIRHLYFPRQFVSTFMSYDHARFACVYDLGTTTKRKHAVFVFMSCLN